MKVITATMSGTHGFLWLSLISSQHTTHATDALPLALALTLLLVKPPAPWRQTPQGSGGGTLRQPRCSSSSSDEQQQQLLSSFRKLGG